MLRWFTYTLLWSAPLSQKQTWPFYLSITWLLLRKEFFSSLFQLPPSWFLFILSDSLISRAPLFFFSEWFPSCFFSCLSLRSHLLLFKGRYLWSWGRGVSVLFLVHWACRARCTSVMSFLSSGSFKAQRGFNFLSRTAPRHLCALYSWQLGLYD